METIVNYVILFVIIMFQFICKCYFDFKDSTVCEKNDCVNNSTCTYSIVKNSHECICSLDHYGDYCENSTIFKLTF